MVEHNIIAISKIYDDITFVNLAKLVGVNESDLHKVM